MNTLSLTVEQKHKLLIAEAEEGFKIALKACGADVISFAGDIMPRPVWSEGVVMALVYVGAIQPEQCDTIKAVLNSAMGNSSQYGASLLKEGTIKRKSADNVSESLIEKASRMQADREAARQKAIADLQK
jgi:hypothetical protein